MDNRINFNDAALCDAALKAAPGLLNFTANLDRISEDIKRLEAWFAEHGLCIEISMKLGDANWVRSDGSIFATEKRRLKWEKNENRWRLMYEARYIHSYDSDYNGYSSKPLIETPAETRIRVREYLPAFLRVVADRLPSDSSEPLDLEEAFE